LIIQRCLTLQWVAVSPDHAPIERIEIMPDSLLFAFGAVTRRIAVRRYQTRGRASRTEKNNY